jgi:hypothetical protein
MKTALLIVALLSVSCARDVTPSAPAALPAHGEPFRIDVSTVPGITNTGGSASITAHVMDAYAADLAGVVVTFSADAGTFSAASATTNALGRAETLLSADPGTVAVVVSAGAVRIAQIVSIQPHQPTVIPPPQPPPPPVPPAPTPTPRPPAPPLIPVITVTCTGTASLQTRCVAASDSGTLTVDDWQWGDGETVVFGNGPIQTHAYAKAGSYVVVVSAHVRGSAIGTGLGVAEVK